MTGYAVQRPTKYCHACGAVIDAEAAMCTKCGVMQPGVSIRLSDSEKRILPAALLAFFLGIFGAHRFYVGKIGTGILQLCTLGGCGLWWLYDLILIGTGSFKDAQGRLVRRWEFEEALALTPPPSETMEELDLLRSQVFELTERLDFMERLLASPDRDPVRPPAFRS